MAVEYPNLNEALQRAFPDIFGDASAPPCDEVPSASAAAAAGSFIASTNGTCPMCTIALAGSVRPVVTLQCGHAYHLSCGRSFVDAGEGRECTHDTCHRSTQDVVADRMREAVEGAVARGEFNLADLSDPMRSQAAHARIAQFMRATGTPLDTANVEAASTAEADVATERQRLVETYRREWRATKVGGKGFGVKKRIALLAPYIGAPKAVLHKRETPITMADLYKYEQDFRRSERDDAREDTRAIITGEVLHAALVEPDDEMLRHVSVGRLEAAAFTVADLYFGLNLTTWQALKALGLQKSHLTNMHGAFPIVAVKELYGITFTTLYNDLDITALDLGTAQVSSQELKRMNVPFQLLFKKMGLTKQIMPLFGYSPEQWVGDVAFQKKWIFEPVKLTAADITALRWTRDEVREAFQLTPPEERRMFGAVDDAMRAAQMQQHQTLASQMTLPPGVMYSGQHPVAPQQHLQHPQMLQQPQQPHPQPHPQQHPQQLLQQLPVLQSPAAGGSAAVSPYLEF